ncbi:MAG TPA: TOBE domain-containing protein [Candidatus Limnocylindrales bacterium]|nr:TOBE domain-containing protein [Candidatus Limnocylindrales bacterium]
MARKTGSQASEATVRVGRAAEMLGVSVDTVRRWIDAGRMASTRSATGQRSVSIADVTRLAAERRSSGASGAATGASGASVATSARNRFPGVVTRIEVDRVAAVVEVQAGPHRLVSLMTAEAVAELNLKVGDAATCVVKATNVVVEIPAARERR